MARNSKHVVSHSDRSQSFFPMMAAANITAYEIPSIAQKPYLGISFRLRVTPAACASQTFRQINQETSGGANNRIHAVEFTGPPRSLRVHHIHLLEIDSTIKSKATSRCHHTDSTRTSDRLLRSFICSLNPQQCQAPSCAQKSIPTTSSIRHPNPPPSPLYQQSAAH